MSLMAPTQAATRIEIIRKLLMVITRRYLILVKRRRSRQQTLQAVCKMTMMMPAVAGLENEPTQVQIIAALVRRQISTLFLAYHLLLVICSSKTQQCGSSTWNFFQLLMTPTQTRKTNRVVSATAAKAKGKIEKETISFAVASWIRLQSRSALKVKVISLTGKMIFFLRMRVARGLCTILSVIAITAMKQNNTKTNIMN